MKSNKSRLDHINPLGRGGADHRCNLALVCRECDIKKGGTTPVELLRWAIRVLMLAVLARIHLWHATARRSVVV